MGAGIAAAAIGAAGAIGGGILNAKGSKPPSAGKMIRSTAQGTASSYADWLPQTLLLNQQYNPYVLGQQGMDLNSLLFGTPGGTREMQGMFWDAKNRRMKSGVQSYEQEATPGIVSTLGRLSEAMRGIEQSGSDAARQADIDALNRFLPGAKSAYEASTPEQTALRGALSQSAMQQMGLGSQIAPEDSYRITSQVRNDWANRGLGASNPAMLSEAMQLFGGGEQLRQSRQGFGLNTLDALARTQPDYAGFILNQRGNLPTSLSMLGMQQPIAYQGLQFNPWNQPQGAAIASAQGRMQAGQNTAGALMGTGMGLANLAGTLYQNRTPAPASNPGFNPEFTSPASMQFG
jgi:hypothetical protein